MRLAGPTLAPSNPPMPNPPPRPSGASRNIEDLLDIMRACAVPMAVPGTAPRTFETIAPYTIEEAYEVAAAIEDDDFKALPDELGDLLFQVVFHARMAEEAGLFDFGDVVEAVTDKMIRRHPHVFGGAEAPSRRRTARRIGLGRAQGQASARPRRRPACWTMLPVALPALTAGRKTSAPRLKRRI